MEFWESIEICYDFYSDHDLNLYLIKLIDQFKNIFFGDFFKIYSILK